MIVSLINIVFEISRIILIIWALYHFCAEDKEKNSTLWYGMFALIFMCSGNIVLWR